MEREQKEGGIMGSADGWKRASAYVGPLGGLVSFGGSLTSRRAGLLHTFYHPIQFSVLRLWEYVLSLQHANPRTACGNSSSPLGRTDM